MYLYFVLFFILIGANYHIIWAILSPQSISLNSRAGTGARILWMEGTSCREHERSRKSFLLP